MATADIYCSVGGSGYYASYIQPTYDDAYFKETGVWVQQPPNRPILAGQGYRYNTDWPPPPDHEYSINRGLFSLDEALPSSPIYITEAYLFCPVAQIRSDIKTRAAILIDGNDIDAGEEEGYGQLRSRNGPLAWYPIEVTSGYEYPTDVEVPFTNAGKQFLQSHAGEVVAFGLRMDGDIIAVAPGIPAEQDEYYSFMFHAVGDDKAYLHIVYSAEAPPLLSVAYIWVEGTKFAYLDEFRHKRTKEGTLTGLTGECGDITIDSIYLYYPDESGNVRRIEGTLTGLTGKTPYQKAISLTRCCYIDSSGCERCFQGDLA